VANLARIPHNHRHEEASHRHRLGRQKDGERDRGFVYTTYIESLNRAGAVPVLIPPQPENAADVLDGLDGILLAGGDDCDPSEYGEERHPSCEPMDPRFRITSPPNDATYLFDLTLHREFRSLHLRATHDATWVVDGKPVSANGRCARGSTRSWPRTGGGNGIVW
jgi:Peptidase C26